ncbi:MAG: hypothetical protein RIB58_00815 [Phycisphaerales bacterium]
MHETHFPQPEYLQPNDRFPISTRTLEAQVGRAADAIRAWDGGIDLPSNPILLLLRDADNLETIDYNRELALEVCIRVMDNHLGSSLVRQVTRMHRGSDRTWLLGYAGDAPPMDLCAVLIRELCARFVEAGLGSFDDARQGEGVA